MLGRDSGLWKRHYDDDNEKYLLESQTHIQVAACRRAIYGRGGVLPLDVGGATMTVA